MAPMAPTPPQMPSALLRSAPSGNMFITIERAAGQHEGRPEALDPPHDDQEGVRGGEPAAERGGGEDGQARHEHAPTPKQVGGPAAEEQEAPEGQTVGGDHPLQIGLGEVELHADGGQGHVDDREVHDGHEVGHDQQGKGRPPPHAARRRRRPPSGAGLRLPGRGGDGIRRRTSAESEGVLTGAIVSLLFGCGSSTVETPSRSTD